MSHGSSGGPILNKFGEVIGVTVGAFKGGQNLNFAVPVSKVIALLDDEAYRIATTPPDNCEIYDDGSAPRIDSLIIAAQSYGKG